MLVWPRKEVFARTVTEPAKCILGSSSDSKHNPPISDCNPNQSFPIHSVASNSVSMLFYNYFLSVLRHIHVFITHASVLKWHEEHSFSYQEAEVGQRYKYSIRVMLLSIIISVDIFLFQYNCNSTDYLHNFSRATISLSNDFSLKIQYNVNSQYI